MDRLYKGIRKFQQLFKKEEEFYKNLSKGQSPDTLFITCSDSRVDPNIMTQSKPGELFIVKNVGNIIPAYNLKREKASTAAAIEFALLVLKVPDIVVCGHSDCGAMKALYHEESEFIDKPHLKDWIDSAASVKDMIRIKAAGQTHTPEIKHIMLQMENLKTYPVVNELIREEKLKIHGWYFDIGTGDVYAYDTKSNNFDKIRYDGSGA